MKLLAKLALPLVIVCLFGCGQPDQRITAAIDAVQQGQAAQARNADRVWVALIGKYSEQEMTKIDGYYAKDVATVDAGKPKKTDYADIEAYAEALIDYSIKRTTFLQQSEVIRQRNIAKLNNKIADANAKYEAVKQNQKAYMALLAKLKEYEEAKIDPRAAPQILREILAEFIPIS